MTPCINCRLNKKKIFLNLDRARQEAKQLAITNEETYAIYKKDKAVSITTATDAATSGYDIIEFLSFN